MKKYPHILISSALIALCLSVTQFANAACDLQIVSAGPCLADGMAGNPSVGAGYGLKLVLNIIGTPSAPFEIVWTMANVTYSNTVTVGPGRGYTWYYDWDLDLDDAIPWSVTLDPAGVSGNTNLANHIASGTFTPTPPITATDLFDPQVWNGTESYILNFFPGGTLASLYVVFGVPTTHGAQTVLSVSGPADAEYVATPPYGEPIFQTSWSNVPAGAFSDTNNFVVQLSRTRVNPTILRTNTWADLSTLTTNWTQWLAPDGRCQSTNPVIVNFVQQSLPVNYQATLTPYDTARSLHQTVMKTLTYQEPPPAIDAVGVLEDGIADCGGFAALLTACLRNVGIPARCISGFRQGEDIPHVRVEFHLPGTEWIVADPTDGNTNDPTGTFAYDFGVTSDSDRYVAVDAGDAHVLPYYTFEFIQIPNFLVSGDATEESYTPTYALTATPSVAVEASPSSAGTVSGAGAYPAGTNVQIFAAANSGWSFIRWSDGNPQNPRTVTVPVASTNYIALFIQPSVSIHVSGNLAFGNVATGTTATATLTINNTGNTPLTVSSIAYPSGFSGNWSSGSILAGGSQQVTVTFAPTAVTSYGGTVTVTSDATSGTGTMAASGAGVATPVPTATITVQASPSNGGTVSGNGTYPVGSSQQISAGANNGWTFTGWSDGGVQTHEITVPATNITYTANFTSTACTYTLNAASVTLTAKGGAKTVSVKVKGTDCVWTAQSNDPFITITAGGSGTGNGKVDFTVAGNTNMTTLTGTLTIAGQTFTVHQAVGGCTFKLSPPAGKCKAAGGSATVKLTPNLGDCEWTAVSNDAFITITAGASGVGKGTVSYTFAANTTASERIGTISVAGETFTITQAGEK